MKNIKTSLILLLTSSTSVSYGVTLPSHPFFGANELYEEGHDYVEYSVGTQIRNVNILISEINSAWGDACLDKSLGEEDKCQDCCDETWNFAGYKDEDEISYNTCMKICGGTSLPLGSTLWLIPFVLVYAVFKRFRTNKQEVID